MLQHADRRHEIDAVARDHMKIMGVGDEIHPRTRLYVDADDLGIGRRCAECIRALHLFGPDVEDHGTGWEKLIRVRSYLPI